MSINLEPRTWRERYELLDGIRGLAALAVVLHHVGVAEIGHCAVLVFFVISGYCITASAESGLRAGVGFAPFMMKRASRIYPPYLLAIAFFAVTRAVRFALSPHVPFERSWLEWVQNITLTQWLTDLVHPVEWPGQNRALFVSAFWSLNYEEQFYLVVAVGLAVSLRARVPLVLLIGVLSAVGFLWNWTVPGQWISGLFIEYWVHFALGAFLYYVLCRYTVRTHRAAFVALTLGIGLLCLGRILIHGGNLWDLRAMTEICFLSGITLCLYYLRPLSHRISISPLWSPVAALGAVSYSLYLVHQFNLSIVASIAQKILPRGSPAALLVCTIICLHIALAAAFWYLCERPFLRKRSEIAMSLTPDVPLKVRAG